VRHLDKNIFQPFILLPVDGPLVGEYRKADAQVLILPMLRLTRRLGFFHQLRYVLMFLPTVLSVCRIIRTYKIDLVHTNTLHSWYGCFAARITRRSHIWHLREIVAGPRWMNRFERFLVRHFSDCILSMSDAILDALGLQRGVDKSVVTLHEGVDLAEFNPDARGQVIRREWGVRDEERFIGLVCRLDPWKGVDTFLKAAAAARAIRSDLKFLVCGGEIEGHRGYESELRKLARDLGLERHVFFSGWTYGVERMPLVMAALDILVNASRLPEPYGLTIVEAMAAGKAVIAPREGGPKEIVVHNTTGLLIEPRDEVALSGAMIALAENTARRRAMGLEGRSRAERFFDVKAHVTRIENTYRNLNNGRHKT